MLGVQALPGQRVPSKNLAGMRLWIRDWNGMSSGVCMKGWECPESEVGCGRRRIGGLLKASLLEGMKGMRQ